VVVGLNKIEVKGLTKRFGDFTAVDHMDLAVKEGEIRALIGENGAGKTTLMNMLYGLLQPDEGEILINGEQVRLSSPLEAIAHGIGMVHQHFKLVPSLTVYENLMLGTEIRREVKVGGATVKLPMIDTKQEKKAVQEIVDRFNFMLEIERPVSELSVGERQRLEILKMLYRNVDILILDEPTAVLTPQEVDMLIDNLRALRESGKTIILITHKLTEVKLCADVISVIRAGKHIATMENNADATPEVLAEKMVGRKVATIDRSRRFPNDGEYLYKIDGLCAKDRTDREVLRDVSLQVRAGEILGVAGVEGNGQSELIMIMTGLMKRTAGTITIGGADASGDWPYHLKKKRFGIIPEDRYARGLCLDMKVSDNLIAGFERTEQFSHRGLLKRKAIQENQKEKVRQFDIRLSSKDPLVSELSGGNAQKIIIARELGQDPEVMLACQPTRGLDMGATEFVHRELLAIRDQKKAVLLVSSDLSEIMTLSDRIVVMYRGRIVGEFRTDDVTPEELGLYMVGAKTMRAEEG